MVGDDAMDQEDRAALSELLVVDRDPSDVDLHGPRMFADRQFCMRPGYGYALLKTLDAAGIPSDGNTVYPLLRRLEERGLLESEWNTEESRPRKFYRTTQAGSELATQLLADMADLTASLDALNERTDR
jgi:PadR family transcriptional regulator PadR